MNAKQVIFEDKLSVRLVDIDVEAPRNGELTVAASWSMISPGTELAFLRAMPGTGGIFPQFTGYSTSGIVTAVGDDVEGYKPGDHIVAQSLHQSSATVDQTLCAKLSDAADLREAAMFRIATIALGGVRKGQVQLGSSVLVVGLGLIGNLACQFARAAGATSVVGVDPVRWRRDLATRCSIEKTVENCRNLGRIDLPDHVRKHGFDTVIEATGVPSVFNEAVTQTKRRGVMVLLGSSRGLTEQVNFYRDVHRKGITLIGAHDSIRPGDEDLPFWFTLQGDIRTVLEMLAAGRLNVSPLISGDVPANEAPSAYERLCDGSEQLMTLAICW